MKPIFRVWTLPWQLQHELMSRSLSQWRTTGEQRTFYVINSAVHGCPMQLGSINQGHILWSSKS